MVKIDVLIRFINNIIGQEWLEKARKKDEHMPNGLQWRGKDEIKKIVLGVSANEQFFKEAVRVKADALIVHHGLQIDIAYNLFSPSLQKRLKVLTENNLSLFGYHYVLDIHPEIGNNAQIIQRLGAKKTESTLYDGWGWVAEFAKKQTIKELTQKCTEIFSHDIILIPGKKERVGRIGVVSGRGVPFPQEKRELIEKGVEAYITGEISEWNVQEFKELGISYLAGGHYATEVFGVQELGKKIKSHFKDKLEVEFIDIPNPV